MWPVDEVIKAVNGVPRRIERDAFASISTDSRTIGEGELFVPLSGANFDGHLFIGKAYDRSHGGTICEKKRSDICENIGGTTILVDDAMQALLDLARWKRANLRGTCIAITGSNGKTTTKEILVAMIRKTFSVACNEKNFNNLVGVSKSLLAVTGNPDFLVFELGTNSPGEIGVLARTTQPDLSLITNINPSHLEGLLDLEGVLKEKLDLFRGTKEGGRIFFNADDPHLGPAYEDTTRIVCPYSMERAVPFRLSIVRDLGWEGYEIHLDFKGNGFNAKTSLLGRHNLYNILAASAIAWSAGVDTQLIAETIETFGAFAMRLTPIESKMGYKVLDDTYNANPSSMEWAVRTLESLPCTGKRIAIIGDMKELGERTIHYHEDLGRFLKGSAIPMVFLIGEYVRETFEQLGPERGHFFEDKKQLIQYVTNQASKGDVILVKGSRAAKMEEIVEALI
jgi:UDP-N-acetylmuramoyl-tripeptide--D-alanyl-D-alanine ligase